MKAASVGNRFTKAENLKIIRNFFTSTNFKQGFAAIPVLNKKEIDIEYEKAKPFHEIPGPKPLPIPHVGNFWRFLPFGTYGNMDMLDIHFALFEKYGPIVRFEGLGNMSQVFVFEPESVEKVFRNESIYPNRHPIPSLKHYRDVVRKDFYQNRPGLVTSNGEEWYNFRKATNQVMMHPDSVKPYLNSVVGVVDEFLDRIRYIRQSNDEMPDDFIQELNKLSLEIFTLITLDTRLGCLKNNLSPDSEAVKMITCVKEVLALMYELDFKPSIWHFVPTPNYKKFVKSMNYTLDFSIKHINAKWKEIKEQGDDVNKSNRSTLESLLLRTKDPKIPIVMASDTLIAGVDTTSNTLGTTLYLLSQNPEKQEKLYDELKKVLPNKNSVITEEIFNKLKYTRAVIKESMRLHPTVVANLRGVPVDIVLKNYQIPKGTNILMANSVMCRSEKYFKNALEFLPERWLKSDTKENYLYKSSHPFTYLPFGFGQRSCIGKRFAYMELDVSVTKIIRNFRVSYHYEPMTWTTRFVRSFNKPLKFKMTERPE